MARKYKLGDMWSADFDYDGMVEYGRTIDIGTSEKTIEKYADSLEDVNYHTLAKPLFDLEVAMSGDKEKIKRHFLVNFRRTLSNQLVEFGDKPLSTDEIYFFAKGGVTYVNDDFPELVDSQTYVIDGVYGANERESEIYVKELSDGGKWYALKDSKNINFTNDSLYDGINVEEVQDLETISSSSPIEYADDLDERIVSHYGEELEERGDDYYAKGGEVE